MQRDSPLSLTCVCWLMLVCVRSLCADDAPSATPQTLTFAAMGDVPYAPLEYDLLREHLEDLGEDIDFVVHLGDIKRGLPLCPEFFYSSAAEVLKASPKPVFILPGDNEWNDCSDPAAAWTFWQKHFDRFEQRWEHPFQVHRPKVHSENFAFVAEGVLIIGINIVGGRVHDEAEWRARHAADARWVSHALTEIGPQCRAAIVCGHARPTVVHDDFFIPLAKSAEAFQKPMLYIHGDGHKWDYEQRFKVDNLQRLQVDQGGIARPVLIHVTGDAETCEPGSPFEFDRRKEKESSQE